MDSLNELLNDEMALFDYVSVEEWDLIKPLQSERVTGMISKIRMMLADDTKQGSKCGSCINWQMRAAEMKDGGNVNNLDVGSWEPTQGLALKDDLFPHLTGGFRGRTIRVTSIQVSGSHCVKCSFRSFTNSFNFEFQRVYIYIYMVHVI